MVRKVFVVIVVALLTAGSLCGEETRQAKLLFEDDLVCNSEAVRKANSEHLLRILGELTDTTYFRLFRVQLDGECPLDHLVANTSSGKGHNPSKQEEEEEESSCGPDEDQDDDAPPLCDVKTDSFMDGFVMGGTLNPVDKTLSKKEDKVVSESEEECDDESLPTFWTNLCAKLPFKDSSKEYINLKLNPEQYTGYNGSKVWKAIYEENCFEVQDGEEDIKCMEERFLHKMLSGLHSTINLHISENFKPPIPGVRENWERNLDRFKEQFDGHPERFKNMEFAFVVLLRAVRRATPVLREFQYSTGDTKEDHRTLTLVKMFLDSFVLSSCQEVFEAFDESLLFVDDSKKMKQVSTMTNLKKQFKDIFHNISSIFNCIRCQKCRLHGKLQLLGIGTALKILLLPKELIRENLTREEVVALFNTVAKFSEAIEIHENLKGATIAEVVVSSSKDLLQDSVVVNKGLAMIAEAVVGGKLSAKEEDLLVDALIDGNKDVQLLAQHFAQNIQTSDSFLRHALRRLDRSLADSDNDNDELDAIVIGAGLSGLVTTLSILDRGGSVILIDKEGLPGGNSAKASSGVNGIDNSSATLYDDSVERFREDVIRGSGRPSFSENPLVDILTKGSVDALEWLRSRVGLPLNKVGQLGGHSRPRTWRPSTGLAGSELIASLSRSLKRIGDQRRYQFYKNTEAVKLLMDDEGNVEGARCKNIDSGKEFELRSKAVVIATGGYGFHHGKDSLLAKHRPDLLRFGTTNGKFATGDGIKLGLEAGAGTIDIDQVQVHPTAFVDPKDPDDPVKTLAAELLRGIGAVILDKSGNRFVNELETRKHVSEAMLKRVGGENQRPEFLMVLSADAAALAPKHVPLYERKGLMKRYESIDALAGALGVSAQTIRKTFSEFDRSMNDPENFPDPLNRTVFPASPMSTGAPYYAGWITPAVHYTMGGLKIDEQGRAVDELGNNVGGGRLFVVGEAMGGIHGDNRLGGNALTECAVFGRHVGANLPLKSRAAISSLSSAAEKGIEEVKLRRISPEELGSHHGKGDVWVAIDGKVYDFTSFAPDHPGGPESITSLAGEDGSSEFYEIHTAALLEDFEPIGQLAQ